MPDPLKTLNRSGWLSTPLKLGSLVLMVAVLYLAREVFIPMALAVLFSFVLGPVVTLLRRHGLGRTLSVAVTVALAFVLIAGIGSVIVVELRGLAEQLPAYRQNILKKVNDLRVVSKAGWLQKLQGTIKEVSAEIQQTGSRDPKTDGAVPVVVKENQEAPPIRLPSVNLLLETLASVGFVIVLVIFMLLRREELRDRVLRLAGYGGLAATTKAIDEAARLVSRYLLRQLLLNSLFGICVAIGLSLIGLPYAVLWGVLAGAARFIPYVGPLLGAALPILLSLAVFESWTAPLLVIGLITVLELINNMVLEPLLYGQSIGVSEVALLIMLAFWTWLWGPIGLLLSTPLTVCLMVLSNGVPGLQFIARLLSSEPALAPHHVLYQRLIARDEDEVHEIVETFLKEHTRTELFEQLFLPALIASRHDYRRNQLGEEDIQFAFRVIRNFLETTEDWAGAVPTEASSGPTVVTTSPVAVEKPASILGYPANDEADELALLMLAELLQAEQWSMRVVSSHLLSAEATVEADRFRPAVVCIGFLPQGPILPVRHFCKRLNARLPGIPIVIGRWGASDLDAIRQRLAGLVADVGGTLSESKNQLVQFGQTNPAPGPEPEEQVSSRAAVIQS